MTREIHPIEAESYRRLRARVDTSGLPPLTRAVVERVIHATAEPAWRDDLVCDEAALAAGRDALAAGAPIACDVRMVAAGLTGSQVVCRLPDAAVAARRGAPSRTAAGIQLAFADVGPGAVWVIGNAPTALRALLALDARPALVIGLPVGYVDAVESKAALRASGWPAVTNRSVRGGAGPAVAACNALRNTL